MCFVTPTNDDECESGTQGGITGTVCVCHSDLCNSAGLASPTAVFLVGSLMAAFYNIF
jgi:hypothetical protein